MNLPKNMVYHQKIWLLLLTKQGFDVSSHMAVLSDEAIKFLKNKFEKKPEETSLSEPKQPIAHSINRNKA